MLELARAGKLPEDLKNEATTLLHTSPDRRVREQADTVLPLPKTAAGRPLPSIFELIRRDGDAEKGRAVFFRAGTNSVRQLPPGAGARPVGRAGPLDDRGQVRPRRADPLDLEPERRHRLQLPFARAWPWPTAG